MQTAMAHLRCIGRWHQNHRDTCQCRLIGHVLSQLEEGPTIPTTPFFLAPGLLIGALTNAGQVFQRNASVGRPCRRDQGLGDDVVCVALKALLCPRQPVQELTAPAPRTPGALRGFALQSCPQSGEAVPTVANVTPIPTLPLAGMGNVCPSQVHPQYICGWRQRWQRHFDLDMDRIGTIAVLAQLGACRLVARELAALVVAQDQAKVYATMQQRETHAPVSFSEREDTLVVLDTRGVKRFDLIAVCFRSFAIARDAAKGLLREIGGEPKASTHVIVEHGLHAHDVDDALRNRGMDIGARVGKCLQRCGKVLGFFGSRLNLADQCQCLLHAVNYISMLTCMLRKNRPEGHGLSPYLPSLNGLGFTGWRP